MLARSVSVLQAGRRASGLPCKAHARSLIQEVSNPIVFGLEFLFDAAAGTVLLRRAMRAVEPSDRRRFVLILVAMGCAAFLAGGIQGQPPEFVAGGEAAVMVGMTMSMWNRMDRVLDLSHLTWWNQARVAAH